MADQVQISAADHQLLTNAYKLLGEMNGNPDARSKLEAALKVVRPDVETEADKSAREVQPHLAPITEALEKINKRFEDEDAARTAAAEAKATSDLESAFSRLKSDRNYTDDGIEQVKQIMLDRKVADPEVAAAYFEKTNPPATVEQPGWTPQGWDLNTSTGVEGDLKALFANEDAWADNQVAKVLNEIRVG